MSIGGKLRQHNRDEEQQNHQWRDVGQEYSHAKTYHAR